MPQENDTDTRASATRTADEAACDLLAQALDAPRDNDDPLDDIGVALACISVLIESSWDHSRALALALGVDTRSFDGPDELIDAVRALRAKARPFEAHDPDDDEPPWEVGYPRGPFVDEGDGGAADS